MMNVNSVKDRLKIWPEIQERQCGMPWYYMD